ncbi:hypothetical protein V5O48_003766 [Marasmius crinis-equi]|uniref:Cytochrome P450 n=1 Tax=Marasmius crinis-equi TaxID=585013 RepID=A0ABR3FS69_9AGAR
MDNKTFLLPAVGIVTVLAIFRYGHAALKRSNPAPLPPGPKGIPILGNILDLPRTRPWITFAKWAQEYGPITHVRVLGQSIIVLNDATDVFGMLDKKGKQYSNRPRLVMAGELVGWDQGPALAQSGKRLYELRRLMARAIGTRSKIDTSYGHIIQGATRQYLKDVLRSPTEWVDHNRRYVLDQESGTLKDEVDTLNSFAADIVLRIAYGYQAKDKDDPLISVVDEAMSHFSETTATNAFLVDTFPILRYVPEWFPGAGWKKQATHYHATLETMLNKPFEMVKKRMADGTSPACFLSDLLSQEKQSTPEEESIVKWAAAGIYSGGAETTATSMEAFILAMTLHPEAQQKAQQELDTVLGRGVMPTPADRSRLPYNEALMQEVFRVYSIGPLGLPHVAIEDDIHNGYFIPKGSIILANSWQFYRDSKSYANPSVFNPDRFIASENQAKERDSRNALFGYGRR